MRNILYITLFGFTVLSGISCKKDFLNTSSPSEYTEDLVFSSTANTELAINGTYALLTQDQLYSARLPLNYSTNSDIEVAGADTSSYNADGVRSLSNYLGKPDNSSLSKEWTLIYKMIERANLCIDGIKTSPVMKTSDSTAMKAYLGEAITIRALAYFDLVKNWGDVPFKTERTKYDLSNVYLSPTDRDSIYDYLIADLQEAENYVPWLGSGIYGTPERITKGFVKGLLARIALFRGGYSIRNRNGSYPTERGSNYQKYYELARKECQEIMAKSLYSLTPTYADIWNKLCQYQVNSAENLYEVPLGLGRSGEMGYSIGVRFYTNAKYGFGNNANVVNTTAYYFYSFDRKDIRRDITVAYYNYSNGSAQQKEFMQSNPMGFNIAKWDQRKMNSAWLSMNKNASAKFGYGINWVIMRYADVLLMYAEAENELNGPSGAAKNALKQVRYRAFASADWATKVDAYVDGLGSKQAFFDAIVNERAWEFGGEGLRKYDLVRWNLLVSKIQEQRDVIKNMLAGAAPYNTLPKYLFYKYNSDNETLAKDSINFYEDKGSDDIPGYTKMGWLNGLSASDQLKYSTMADRFSSGLNTVILNRHLFPFNTDVVGQSQGTLQNAYGF